MVMMIVPVIKLAVLSDIQSFDACPWPSAQLQNALLAACFSHASSHLQSLGPLDCRYSRHPYLPYPIDLVDELATRYLGLRAWFAVGANRNMFIWNVERIL